MSSANNNSLNDVLKSVTKDLYKKNLALNIEHKRLEDILLQVAESIFAIDKSSSLTLFNAASETLFGVHKEKAIGSDPDKHIFMYSVKDNSPVSIKHFAFKLILKKEETERIERVYVFGSENEKTYFKLNYKNIEYSEGSAECVVSLVDITHEVLVDMQKDEFISIASHELKTPISIVKTNLWMLKHFTSKKKSLDETELKFVSEIDQGIVRLARIVNNLLDISRIEQGRFVIEEELHNVDDVIKTSVDSFHDLAKNKGLKLIGPTHKIGDAFIDKDRFLEVLDNFISNALKYTEKGGIKINAWSNASTIKVSITDSGPGISTIEQKRLFKKFSRTKEGLKQHSVGASTGLGLYICKRIIEEMGGVVGVKSIVEKGSTFWFTIPKGKSASVKSGDVTNPERIKQQVMLEKANNL